MGRLFDTIDGWLGSTATLGFTFPCAASIWFRMDLGNLGCLLARITATNRSKYMEIYVDAAGKPKCTVTDGTTTVTVSAQNNLGLDAWHHVLVVVAAADQRIYENGSGRGTDTGTLPSITSMGETSIGGRKNGASSATDLYAGTIAQVALWDLDDGAGGTLWSLAESDDIAKSLYERACSPLEVYPFQLAGYWTLMGTDLDSWTRSTNGTVVTMTEVGSTVLNDDPPMSRPTRSRWPVGVPQGGPEGRRFGGVLGARRVFGARGVGVY